MKNKSTLMLLCVAIPLLVGCASKRYVQAQINQIEHLDAQELQQTRADVTRTNDAHAQTELFAEAYKQASNYTLPVIVSVRFFDKSVVSMLATFVVLNSDGWIVTAGHVFEYTKLFKQHAPEIAAYSRQLSAINADPMLSADQKQAAISALKSDPHWVTNVSYWWAGDGLTVSDVSSLLEADLAIGRLIPFDPRSVAVFPTLKNPEQLANGTSLCKLGFPFYAISTTFDEGSGIFRFPANLLPIPRFPIEGIYTRTIDAGKSGDGKYAIQFLETSSPGLRGQSGGPIFDTAGRVWSIQLRTQSLPLDFAAPNQYLNVGVGVHPALLIQFLKDHSVNFHLSE